MSMKIKVKCPRCGEEFEIEIVDESARRALVELLMYYGLGKGVSDIAIATLSKYVK